MKNVLLLATATMIGLSAQAAPITGSIDIGAFNSTVTVDKGANTVTFNDAGAPAGNAIVGFASGALTPYLGEFASYQNFSYDPLSVVNPLWNLVSFAVSFDLQSITSIDETGPGLILTGTGILTAPGFDPTAGVWSFSADSATGGRFTFSSQTAAVPDGGTTLMLLGAALSGLGLIRRKIAA